VPAFLLAAECYTPHPKHATRDSQFQRYPHVVAWHLQ
jgi:hypothetical protein